MGTRLLLLADTHWPRRATALPAPVWEAVAAADVVIHAGDWVEEGLLDELTTRSRRLVACWGNTDRRRQPYATFMTAELVPGTRPAEVPVALHRLPRGPLPDGAGPPLP